MPGTPTYVTEIEREEGQVLTIKDAEARQAISDIEQTIGDINSVLEEVL